MLIGRSAECLAVDRLLRQVRNSRSGSLVIRGQSGIGKSAILGYAAETAGNPLALLEFSREVTVTGDIAGGFGVSPRRARPLEDRVEQQYLARISALPDDTRRLLLLAAAEPVGDPAVLRRAAAALGLGIGGLAPAEYAGLVRLGDQVTFRHPLVRSAIYSSAPAAERQSAHAALAGAIDPEHDPEHRAWHRAQAIFGPDESAAAELERLAGRALKRGGPAAAAAFLERAAALSPDPGERARRALGAAQLKYDAGAPGTAADLLATVDDSRLSELRRAHADELAARISAAVNRAGDRTPRISTRRRSPGWAGPAS